MDEHPKDVAGTRGPGSSAGHTPLEEAALAMFYKDKIRQHSTPAEGKVGQGQ
jgi:hypothetical protein